MDVLWHSLGRPLAERYPKLIWTDGRRIGSEQASQPEWKRSKKVSQHLLSEALDVDGSRKLLIEAYKWAHINLPWWQLLIYFVIPEPTAGLGESMHISMLSEVREVRRKAMYNIGGVWTPFNGSFDELEVA
jgi:hypothetical protein